ncbi:MAG: protein arginine kinase [Planctomycetes bacterium]|nr:protein arginine kinase [Planctomycetota bacterium]
MSTRIRLARNVIRYPFLSRIEDEEKSKLERFLRRELELASIGEVSYQNLDEASQLDRDCLVERHLISRDHASGRGDRGVALEPEGTLSVMVNEEDHLRIQVLRSGFQPSAAWRHILGVDQALESRLDYAFSPDFGYLTACPSNVGTGMRVSVMLHLPALVITKKLKKVFNAVSKINLAVRGFYGEGTHSQGDFYQISNQITLGRSEDEILTSISDYVPSIVEFERNMRKRLLGESRRAIEDRVWRAFGLLGQARLISSEETMDYLSAVRMGVNLGLIEALTIAEVNEMFLHTQPAHLQKHCGRELDSAERDASRADYLRERFAKL